MLPMQDHQSRCEPGGPPHTHPHPTPATHQVCLELREHLCRTVSEAVDPVKTVGPATRPVAAGPYAAPGPATVGRAVGGGDTGGGLLLPRLFRTAQALQQRLHTQLFCAESS